MKITKVSITNGEWGKTKAIVSVEFDKCFVVGVISYVMKYMRKEPPVPKGCNPVFFLSSRKNGGLGARYARAYKDFYMRHSEC